MHMGGDTHGGDVHVALKRNGEMAHGIASYSEAILPHFKSNMHYIVVWSRKLPEIQREHLVLFCNVSSDLFYQVSARQTNYWTGSFSLQIYMCFLFQIRSS